MSGPTLVSTTKHVNVHWLRLAFVLTLALNLGLIGLCLLLSPSFFAEPGSFGYLLEPVTLLAIYAAVGLILLAPRAVSHQNALAIGTRIGLLTGILWIINHAIEIFVALPTPLATLISATAFLGAFLLWMLAGLLAARQTHSLGYGLLAAVWSAMLTVLLTITFGFLLMLVALPQLARQEINDPDFLRSQWNNATLFAIANTLDAGFLHLLEAPIIAVLFGLIGSIVGSIVGRLSASKAATTPASETSAITD